MTARILIVDGVATNRILMRVKLSSAFYDVIQAENGQAAIDTVKWQKPDLVITASRLPDMSGRDLCTALRKDPVGNETPVVLLYDGSDSACRVSALEAGADDVLCEPMDDLVLFARLRSLLRAADAEAELRLRDDTRRALGLADPQTPYRTSVRIGYVHLDKKSACPANLVKLRTLIPDDIDRMDPETAMRGNNPPDVFVIAESADEPGGSGLELLSRLRSNSATRRSSVIYVTHSHQRQTAAAALDLGANDLLSQGPDPEEMALRLEKQILRKLTADRLLDDMQNGLRAAVTDPLTGIYNRRYAIPHMKRTLESCASKGRKFAVLLADLDHFKTVNDVYGHPFGDKVLVEVSQKLANNLRAADMIARLGGEEFIITIPDTNEEQAKKTAQRLVGCIESLAVTLPNGRIVPVTISIGIALAAPDGGQTSQDLIDIADTALYEAKAKGRNCAVLGSPDTNFIGPPETLGTPGTPIVKAVAR